jgi:hypothetical protein
MAKFARIASLSKGSTFHEALKVTWFETVSCIAIAVCMPPTRRPSLSQVTGHLAGSMAAS